MRQLSLLFISLIIFSCGSKTETAQEETTQDTSSENVISETVTAEDFQRLMASTENAVILDVRTPEEYNLGYIEGAVNVDYYKEDFESRLNELDKDTPYFVYCARGRRSRETADKMKELKFTQVYDLGLGFESWSKTGMPAIVPMQPSTSAQ